MDTEAVIRATAERLMAAAPDEKAKNEILAASITFVNDTASALG